VHPNSLLRQAVHARAVRILAWRRVRSFRAGVRMAVSLVGDGASMEVEIYGAH